MKRFIWLFVVTFSLLLWGCSSIEQNKSVTFDVEKDISFPLPATFAGEIPCPDCLRVEIILNLRPGGLYQLRKTYQAEGGSIKVEPQLGRWRYAEEGNFIILGKRKGALKSYAIKDENHLQFMGMEGVEDDAQIQYDLVRMEEIDPFIDTLKLRGMFRSDAEQASLTECRSGRSFPVTGDEEFKRLVQSYMNTPHGYGEPLLVSLQGKLVRQATLDDDGDEQIVVEKFKRFYPNKDCEGRQTGANLTGTIWRLLEVDGQQVTLAEKEQRPYFTMDSMEKELKGSGGCNLISGTYLVKGEIFLIKRLVTTRMACPTGVEVETSFLRALDNTETFRIQGDALQLLDEEGKVRAVMRADL